jgi:hypothetical protein
VPPSRPATAIVALLAAACVKPDDQPKMQAEVVATAARYEARLDELRQRADELDRRRAGLPRDALNTAAAEHSLSLARAALADQRGYLTGARARLKGIRPASLGEVRALLAEIHHRLDPGITEAVAELGAVESWLWVVERQRRPGAPAASLAEPAEPADDRAAETDASGAPVR